MDILKPNLMWIEGTCFRIPFSETPMQKETDEEMYGDYDNAGTECDQDDPSNDFEIDTTESGRYRTVFHVPRSYFSLIIGSKGSTRRRLEDETRTQIRVPRQGQDGDIIITGGDEKGVASARRRINLIVSSYRFKQQCTHFFSIPMVGKEIKSRFINFKEEVCKECNNHRIDESIFQKPDKLHLTLGTMVLSDRQECAQVAELLKNFKETFIQPMLKNEQLTLNMSGVECMNDDPSEVHVLYSKVKLVDASDVNILQIIADNLVDYFSKSGFMQKQYDRVKLHVTLMNTRYRKDEEDASEMERCDRKGKKRESFDATTILKVFENYSFGEQHIEGIHLSQRFTTASDGFYEVSTKIKLT